MLARALLPIMAVVFANLGLAVPTLGPKLVARQGYIANCRAQLKSWIWTTANCPLSLGTATYTIQPFDNCNKIVDDFGDVFTLDDL